jgi:CRISPR-associated endoribonuclease Cas6
MLADSPITDDAPQLAAAILTLRPERAGALLPGSGRAVQAWWLDYVAAAEPALAERLHAGSERRPYACAPLLGLPEARPGRLAPVAPAQTYAIRIAAWEPAVVARLATLIARPPAAVVLGGSVFAVAGAAWDAEAPPATFAALAARHLRPDPPEAPPRDLTLRFLTPTAFRQSATAAGRPAPLPFPAPASLWGGLYDRWQAVAPVRLDPQLRDSLTARVAIGRFEGRSARVLTPGLGERAPRAGATGGQWMIGFVGRCSYWWPRGDGYLGGALRLLAAFAAYAGAGHGTAFGLGQVRVEPAGSPAAGPDAHASGAGRTVHWSQPNG